LKNAGFINEQISNRATRNLDVNRVLFMIFNSDSEFSTLNSGKATELCIQMAEVGNLHIYSRWGFEDKHFSFQSVLELEQRLTCFSTYLMY